MVQMVLCVLVVSQFCSWAFNDFVGGLWFVFVFFFFFPCFPDVIFLFFLFFLILQMSTRRPMPIRIHQYDERSMKKAR